MKDDDDDEAARLSGHSGTFRSNRKNAYLAENDLEALRAWIDSAYQRDLPRRTIAAYTREVERFMLWAVMERKTAMSSMEPADLIEYARFLAAPPAHWQSRAPVMRLSVPWRPMRGPLQASSIAVTMTIIRMLYHDWFFAGYLRLNPVFGYKPETVTISIQWLTPRDWKLIEESLKSHTSSIVDRRTRAAILLMRRCYLRQQDVVGLTFESLVRTQMSDSGFAVPTRDGVLRPIDYETWAAIEAHFSDRVQLIAKTSLGRFENIPDAAVPLIGGIVLAGIREVSAARPIYGGDCATKPNVIGCIQQPTLAKFTLQFFERISHEMADDLATTFLSRARTWLNDPSRQTPERRRKILLDKALGNATHEFVDDPEQELIEQVRMSRARRAYKA